MNRELYNSVYEGADYEKDAAARQQASEKFKNPLDELNFLKKQIPKLEAEAERLRTVDYLHYTDDETTDVAFIDEDIKRAKARSEELQALIDKQTEVRSSRKDIQEYGEIS